MIYCDKTHLISDTSKGELHAFAKACGIEKRWFQDKFGKQYYVLSLANYEKSIEHGAKEISTTELMNILNPPKIKEEKSPYPDEVQDWLEEN